jgi:hypothetical protein
MLKGWRSSRRETIPLSSDASCQLDVLWHDGNTFGVNRAQVGVLEQANQVRLSGLLQRQDGSGLESQVRLELLRQLAHQALEWQLADEQLSGLLVTANLSQGNSAWAVAMGLLHAAGSWGGLTRGLGGQLLAWCPATGGISAQPAICHF